ncbi:hypothetical protein U9M48_031083 [Paspalum notatum var. saurae]|uniref:Resistance protein n=1 Tax=Paspalum notatum var. saurae TaxID=547442 RepID=A0AAQ3U1X9_PASNO
MAELAVGLAKSVVEGTLSKAQAAIAEEAKLRDNAQRDLVFITGEFQMMQSFLKVANTERVENPVVMTWVRQIRELAYDVEDCIEFVVHLDKKSNWWWRMICRCISTSLCISMSLPLDEAVDELEQLKARVEDVSTRNARYSLISDTGSKPVVVQQQQPAPATAVSMLINTGKRQQQGDLSQLLADDKIRVISVWGTGGDLGVTSIIWKAYNDQETRQKFTCRAWVKLMHPFDPDVFVRCLMVQFYANACKEQEGELIGVDVLKRMSEANQSNYLDEFVWRVTTERCLVVLEGLSSMTDWDAITKFFPSRKNRSCIIVSSQQQSEVASLSVGLPYQVLELNQFSVDHTIYAFYKQTSQGEEGAQTTTDKRKEAQDWMTKHALIGRDSEMIHLRQYTSKARFDGFHVMSVWGIAGVGKSAILKCLFCDTILRDSKLHEQHRRTQFEKYAWVDVSYPFNLRDFSRSLLLNFHSHKLQGHTDCDIDTVGSNNPIVECRGILEPGKCLVVIDGLQSVKEWDMIQAELVSRSSKNCIIIITTEAGVARCCRGNKGELVFNVKGLQADAAFELFKTENAQEQQVLCLCPAAAAGGSHSLKELAAAQTPAQRRRAQRRNYELPPITDNETAELEELISKCGGLPKVIVDIARSLATKSAGRMEGARSINGKFMDHLENNRVFNTLHGLFTWMHNYFRTCPDSLKPCIFYLSIFPREHVVRRRRLVRRWIAEGYSRDNDEESAEHNGEKQFSELLDLSIVQQSQENTSVADMRMVLCQVNGFIREYIVKRRMEENLVFELGYNCTLTTQRSGRHLVILKDWERDSIVFKSIDFSRLRSLTVFGSWKPFFISESMKLLRVLDLEDASGSVEHQDLENMVKWLRRLKFLSLRGRCEIHHLPSSLHHLRQLQSLDVRHTSIVTLPESIIKLEKLQYIRAGTTDVPVSAPPPRPHISSSWFCKPGVLVGVKVPRGIGNLTALHTLGVVDVAASGSKTFVKDLKKLTQLRKLGVCGINKKNSKDFFSAIKDHVHLESLTVRINENNNQGCCFKKDHNQGCLEDMISLPCKNLKSLKLHGLEESLPKWRSNQLRKLSKLDLEMDTLTGTDVKFLGELPQLSILRVKQHQDRELSFRVVVNNEEDDSYRNVKVLQIACGCSSSNLHVTFGSSTMEKLELLKVDCCGGSPSYQFSGLENLGELKQVLLLNSSNAETLKLKLQTQLTKHPNKPVVKLEEPRPSS